MKRTETPLADAVAAYIAKGRRRGHMPGHKGRAAGFLARFGELAAWDVTEAEGLDDLNAPEGAILAAERLMAAAIGAKSAYFLINGATAGVQAALLAACFPGETLLLPRNAHRSVWAALSLGDIRPVWLPVAADNGLPLAVTPSALAQALAAHPETRAVFLVNPSFYGVCGDLAGCLKIAREHNAVTVVDEAHGAHLPFVAPELAAAGLGADLVVESWHKSMGSLGQTAVLACNRAELTPERWLSLLQTSSPSYPLLASLDAARADWQEQVAARREHLAAARLLLEQTLAKTATLRLVGRGALPPGYGYDNCKILLYSAAGHSGRQLAAALRTCGVEPEFADGRFALYLLTYADARPEQLCAALAAADKMLAEQAPEGGPEAAALPLPPAAMTPFAAAYAEKTTIPLREAAGRVSAGLLVPYPPGIPAVGLGEVISAELMEALEQFAAAGGHVQGLREGMVAVVK